MHAQCAVSDILLRNDYIFLHLVDAPPIHSNALLRCENPAGNSKSECHDTKPDRIQELNRKGFGSYAQFAWVFFLLLLGYALMIITISYICDIRQERSTGRSLRRQSIIGRDNKYAIHTIGGDSVYQYFLGKSVLGWLFAAAVVTIQIVALLIFVHAAMKDFTDDVSDFIYS